MCSVSAAITAVLHSYTLLVCRQHRRSTFVRVVEPHWYAPLPYIRTCCSSAVNIADLRSYVFQNLVGMYHCQTFVCAPHLPPLLLATFVHTVRLPSTSPTYIRTHCRTSLVRTAVRHFYILHDCRYYRWLHSYVLLVCRQHSRTPFVCIAEPHCYALPSYIPKFSESAAMTTGYIRTLRLPAVIIANLGSDALQNVVGMHRCPTFVRATRLLSTSPTSVRTRCRTSFVCTAIRHLYVLHVYRHCRWLHSYVLLVGH